jgi:hypothetical protein
MNGISYRGVTKLVPSHSRIIYYSRLVYASRQQVLNEGIPRWHMLVENTLKRGYSQLGNKALIAVAERCIKGLKIGNRGFKL